jgi:hypothetical protein
VTSEGEGFLIVLSDVEAKDERDYLAWLTTEHVQERLGIAGFLGVRIFRKPIAVGHQYFIWYRLRDAEVVDSPDYLQRLNNPTPWSRRIMPILGNFGRGGGKVAASNFSKRGDRILVFAFNDVQERATEIAAGINSVTGIGAVYLLATDKGKSAVRTNERELRLSDNSFDGLFIVESSQDEFLEKITKSISPSLKASNLAFGWYREIFSLAS